MLTNSQVLLLGLLFFVFSNPVTYDFVDRFVNVKEVTGPNQQGVAVHTLVFMVVVLALTRYSKALPKYVKLN